MDPKNDVERLIETLMFQEWSEKHTKAYLSDFFCILDKESSDDNMWQVDYYNPEDDTMTSFEVPADKRKKCSIKQEESKVFKKEADTVEQLSVGEITKTDADVVDIAQENLKLQHAHEQPTKSILILQHSKDHKVPIWNVTLMTMALNMFNVKINAITGEVLESSLKSAMSLKREMLSGK